MANLANESITTVLKLERRLLQLINEATAAGFIILEQFGETEETIPELDELQNVREEQYHPTYVFTGCCCRYRNPNLSPLLLR